MDNAVVPEAEAAEVQQQFEQAWQYADVTLTASRF
jgi:hypothetical protein